MLERYYGDYHKMLIKQLKLMAVSDLEYPTSLPCMCQDCQTQPARILNIFTVTEW